MVRRLSIASAFLCLLAGPALAQQSPPPAAAAPASTRCGGLLCDMYYAGKPAPAPGQPDVPSPTALPCHDFLCAAFGGRTPDAPPPAVAQAEAAPAPTPAATSKHKRKTRKAVASAEPAKATANP